MVSKVSAAFAPFTPILRAREDILKDLTVTDSSELMQAKIAAVELHIKDGDDLFRNREYQAALNEYKTAQGLIYSLIYPGFNFTLYATSYHDYLLASANIGKAYLDGQPQIADWVKPLKIEPYLPTPIKHVDPVPENINKYVISDYHEKTDANVLVATATETAFVYIQDGKANIAIDVLKAALDMVTKAEMHTDNSTLGALNLNLAAAYFQAGDYNQASTHANTSLQRFKTAKDKVGQAQALHTAGVCALKKGDTAGLSTMLTQASSLMKKVLNTGTVEQPANKIQPGASANLRTVSAKPIADLKRISGASDLIAKYGVSKDAAILTPILNNDATVISYRISGEVKEYGVIIPESTRKSAGGWSMGILTGDSVVTLEAAKGGMLKKEDIINKLYAPRIKAKYNKDLVIVISSALTASFYLSHLYSFVLPVKIGDCLHELGQFDKAETQYIAAAGYDYLSTNIEAVLLFGKMCENIIEWGNSLYKNENLPGAKTQYEKIITSNGTVPTSYLYTSASLSVPASDAKTVIANILVRPLPASNQEIAYYVLTASCYLSQILQGLDFYGLMLSPIHTFEYLQSVAKGISQEAIQAEREFINFKDHQEAEAATKRDLETALAMSKAEADAQYQQYQAALDDKNAAKNALDLANKRVTDAVNEKNAYASVGWAQIWAQASSQALGGGEDAMWNEISALADALDRGETIHGPGPKLAAAETLSSGRKSYQYELDKMQHNIDQLIDGVALAQSQYNGADARAKSAEIKYQAALNRAASAQAALDAFNNEFFNPDAWAKMASIMRNISKEYLYRAIRIAKLMERAYNFENDTTIKIIKNEYGINSANSAPGSDTILFGGDVLLQDINSFTFTAITNKTRKSSRIKDVISLASDYPAQFDSFRLTGALKFETDLYEFDRRHPGFYGQRIEAVEIEIIGLLPEGGLNGTLTAGGVSRFRKSIFSAPGIPASADRVHQVDTMALSEFTMRNDGFLYTADTGVRGLFQGLGVGTTWQIQLPRRSNNFDFRRIFDVRLILYYTAKYDPVLKTNILVLPIRPGENVMLKNYSLRYDFPDAWYAFYKTGIAQYTIDKYKLPFNQSNFKTTAVNFRVITKDSIANKNINVAITAPNGVTKNYITGNDGLVAINPGNDPAGMVGKTPLGTWKIQVTGGTSITDAGTVKYDRVYNIQMGLEYSFEYPVEEVI
jgi:hypothetical protein